MDPSPGLPTILNAGGGTGGSGGAGGAGGTAAVAVVAAAAVAAAPVAAVGTTIGPPALADMLVLSFAADVSTLKN